MRPKGCRYYSALVAALTVSGAAAQAASACEVENTTTHAKYTGTLQEAVSVAEAGKTLAVKGTCDGNTVIGKNLTITGKKATLNGEGNASVVTVAKGMTVAISGVTITGGSSEYGGGIYNEGVITVSKSVFTENGAVKGAALDSNGGEVTIVKSTFTKNVTVEGVLRDERDSSKFLVSGSKLVSNEGEGVSIYEGRVTLENTKIEKNVGAHAGGAATQGGSQGGYLTLINSSIKSNEGSWGGIRMFEGGAVYLYGSSSVEKNKATGGHGGGIWRESESGEEIVEEPGWTGKIAKNTPEQIYSEGP
jgi:hypothetical protein